MMVTCVLLRTFRLTIWVVLGMVVLSGLLGTGLVDVQRQGQQSAIDLTGTWSTTDGTSVVAVTQKGKHVVARIVVPHPILIERFGWQRGDPVFEGDVVGSDIIGKATVHFRVAARTACPDQATHSADLEMQILGPGQLLGRAKNWVLGADCQSTEGPWNGLEYTRRSFDVSETTSRIDIRVADGILFDLDSSVLKPSALVALRDIKMLVFDTQRFSRVVIEGHTDDQGADTHNQELSLRRAQSVEGWLVQNGVASDKVDATGFGKTHPLLPNTTATNRAHNRRVEIKVTR